MSSVTTTVHITCTLPPEELPAFYSVTRTLCAELAKEKECLYFNVFEIAGQPGVVRLVEIWQGDMAWMSEVQAKKPYYFPFQELVQKISLQPQKVEVMNSVEGFRFMRS